MLYGLLKKVRTWRARKGVEPSSVERLSDTAKTRSRSPSCRSTALPLYAQPPFLGTTIRSPSRTNRYSSGVAITCVSPSNATVACGRRRSIEHFLQKECVELRLATHCLDASGHSFEGDGEQAGSSPSAHNQKMKAALPILHPAAEMRELKLAFTDANEYKWRR
jgi:hypothetical protein